MRIRHKPWARPELEACGYFVQDPSANRGTWAKAFARPQPLHMELGCGKGIFIAQLAASNPDVNYLALDIKSEMLALARRNLAAQDPDPKAHVRLMSQDIERIHLMLSEQDRIGRIYINFCNPWPKDRDNKHRLTHPRQLAQYKAFLEPGGEIRFKTDDDELFSDSLRYFEEAGFLLSETTFDLASSGLDGGPKTEHEEMFTRMGKPIKYLTAVLPEKT